MGLRLRRIRAGVFNAVQAGPQVRCESVASDYAVFT
jgi:hypothetical protein